MICYGLVVVTVICTVFLTLFISSTKQMRDDYRSTGSVSGSDFRLCHLLGFKYLQERDQHRVKHARWLDVYWTSMESSSDKEYEDADEDEDEELVSMEYFMLMSGTMFIFAPLK